MIATLERTGHSGVRRIVRNGEVVAMAQQFANGRWSAYTIEDKRLTPKTFRTPNAVLLWFNANQ